MFIVLLLISLAVLPTSRPSDSVVDDLLSSATTSPTTNAFATTAPTTAALTTAALDHHPRPFPPPRPLTMGKTDPDSRRGTITLSDGTSVTGQISTTAGKPLRIWVEQEKEYHDLPLRSVTSVSAEVLWEKDEPQFRFKESGSDVKVETGKTYPARETVYRFTMSDGSTVTGGIVAPVQVTTADGATTYILHKRDKGDAGQSLADLKYVKQIDFPAAQPAAP